MLEEYKNELRALMDSWWFAYAMGHGCSIPDHPTLMATRQRYFELRALIKEHEL